MKLLTLIFLALGVGFPALAEAVKQNYQTTSKLEDFDPFAGDAGQTLERWDQEYQEATGQSAHLFSINLLDLFGNNCVRENCEVWAQIVRSRQLMYVYINGSVANVFKVSTGIRGRATPNFDKHPDGRIYDQYTSKKFPGGSFNGLGNMPYAVFIEGGFAIHGTTRGNIPRLGHVASHGCVRLHPDNAFYFNRLVRQHGALNVWITIQE